MYLHQVTILTLLLVDHSLKILNVPHMTSIMNKFALLFLDKYFPDYIANGSSSPVDNDRVIQATTY